MAQDNRRIFFCGAMALSLLAAMAGCRQDAGRLDAAEMSDPLMRRAAAKTAEGDPEYAIELYRRILDIAPRNARASLNMAILLHDEEKDYIGAIYHYRRYLDLRPRTEKNEMIRSRIRLASQAYASATMRRRQTEPDPGSELAELEEANEELLGRIERLERELAEARRERDEFQRKAESHAEEFVDREAREPGPDEALRQHRVQRGDTLTDIANRYGVRVGDLMAANDLGNANMIFVGQTLVIPIEEERE